MSIDFKPPARARRTAPGFALVGAAIALAACGDAVGEDGRHPATPHVVAASRVEAGEYLVTLGGCHDCHTPGYAQNGGEAPRALWLTGDSVGFRGGWGTSYPANLRLAVQDMSEDDWVEMAKTRNGLPPMPWPSLHKADAEDLRAIYAYIRSLGPAGVPAPAPVVPGEDPKTPYVPFEPAFPKT